MPETKHTGTAKLRKAELERLICFSPAVHYVATASGDYGATYVSPGIKHQLGFEQEQFTRDSRFWANHIHPDDQPEIFAGLEQLFENGSHSHEYRFRHADGSYRWMHDKLVLIRDEDGNPLEIIGSWLDITTQKEAELALAERNDQLARAMAELERTNGGLEKAIRSASRANKQLEESKRRLEYLALYDTLTGLGNRNLFLKQLEHLIAIAGRNKEEVALLAMDLDKFKEVNDRLGHAAGDEVLRELGARMSQALRQADQKYRIGGDEFAVLLEPGRNCLDGALAQAAKIAQHLAAPIIINGHGYSIGVSIGVAVFPQHGEDPETILRKADAAMYEAKKTRQVVAGASDLDATDVLNRLHSQS